ncbi:MAG: HNH endonuclease [Chloroflexi bacterium]|nr:HNH endonuclease [Chloroflexota bacterium]
MSQSDPAVLAAKDANRAARKAGVEGVLGVVDVRELWQRQPTCLGCGIGRGLDHITPMSKGGPNRPANIQTLCLSCNASKGITDRINRRRLPAWLRRSLEQGAAYPWLVAVKELGSFVPDDEGGAA